MKRSENTPTTPCAMLLTCAAVLASCGASTFAQLQFAPPVVYPVGSAPSAVMAVDLDNDGDLDLVAANRLTHNISVLKNNGDGTYAPAIFYLSHDGPEDSGPRALSHADFDGDGDADVIVVNELLLSVAIMFNDGSGILSAPLEFPVFKRPTDIEATDIDNDGDIDFAISHYGSSTGPVAILRNNGSNANLWLGFAPIESYPVQAGCRAVAAGDLDDDGDEDLAVCNRDSGTVSLLLNDGSGVFTLREHLWIPVSPREISIQDLDGNNSPDLAVADFFSGSVHLIPNRGGTGPEWLGFDAPISVSGGGLGPHGIASGDFDLDGDNDIAMGNVKSSNVSIFENLGSMQFDVQLLPGGAFSTAEVIVHDINEDCAVDIIISNSAASGSVSVLLGQSARCLCYADCDPSTGIGTLDIFDFLCFQSAFVKSQSYACDCDLTSGIGVCDIFDFLCFQSAFVENCP